MEEIMVTKDGLEMPVKLRNKLTFDQLRELGDESANSFEIVRSGDGKLDIKNDPIEKEKLETLRNATLTDSKKEYDSAKFDRSHTQFFEKLQPDLASIQRVEKAERITKALEEGTEIDDQVYYEMLGTCYPSVL